ncbi:ABC transporter ATP-binding protein [Serpentinicella alkaliphila]|uniref:ABC-2 type transport system ATP-binding protein n=1 Tax=Serpentinicella alkaliphila TaxID=1734049 RepID=A0A4R2SPR4_9FIRM|nr:ABC transporter ATP-binding protein [Serpentinicella alkaliphila]QUH24977.1 ABC transporter ATP-binding protein [Serpentinicella alkaliphila]TCP92157.1 ABC-2 type transport system ATP-binding protein [Serpentinicella alkaliphila]
MDKILELLNVTKEYKGFKLDNISFSLDRGYIMGLVGTSGSGKTTIIRLIMNLLAKNGGHIKLFGLDNIENEQIVKEKIGFVYDENIYPVKLPLSHIGKLIAPFYKTWDQQTFDNYLYRFDLNPNSKIYELSKGMKTKFALAIALSHKAELILMDEPTSGLDPIFRRELLTILQEVIEDGNCSVLFSTHITQDLDRVADFITFIDRGKVILSDSYIDIIEKYRLVKAPKDFFDRNKANVIGIQYGSFGSEGLCLNRDDLNKHEEDIIIAKPTIEDIMFYLSKNLTI